MTDMRRELSVIGLDTGYREQGQFWYRRLHHRHHHHHNVVVTSSSSWVPNVFITIMTNKFIMASTGMLNTCFHTSVRKHSWFLNRQRRNQLFFVQFLEHFHLHLISCYSDLDCCWARKNILVQCRLTHLYVSLYRSSWPTIKQNVRSKLTQYP